MGKYDDYKFFGTKVFGANVMDNHSVLVQCRDYSNDETRDAAGWVGECTSYDEAREYIEKALQRRNEIDVVTSLAEYIESDVRTNLNCTPFMEGIFGDVLDDEFDDDIIGRWEELMEEVDWKEIAEALLKTMGKFEA